MKIAEETVDDITILKVQGTLQTGEGDELLEKVENLVEGGRGGVDEGQEGWKGLNLGIRHDR